MAATREMNMKTRIWLLVATRRQKSRGCFAYTSSNTLWYVWSPTTCPFYHGIANSTSIGADCARQRRIPIAAVHLCFAASVIHLIDARPSNPNRSQAIRHLQTCVDSLRDLRTAWCTWSDRALRAVGLLAREWYQCEDVSQLLSCGGPSAPADLAGGQPGENSEMGTNAEGDGQNDALTFLFDVGTPGQDMDSLVKDWLMESGYDLFNAIDG